MDGPIASAVVIPEPEPEPSPSPPRPASPPMSHKRRQSSISSDSSKRPRLTSDAAPGDHVPLPKQTKPPAPVRRERGRERRLFGAVLGALSQNPSTAAQKRRSEIEKRQLAQRKLDDEESEQRKAERTAKRRTQRWREHGRFEREAMRARHANLIGVAHFLRTETEPRLYYKPWETTPEEESCIQDQISSAHDTVNREMEEYEARQDEETRRERQADDGETSNTSRKDETDASRYTSTAIGAANGTTNSVGAPPGDEDTKDHHAETPTNDTIMEDHTREDNTPSHVATIDMLGQDHMDEMGEEIVEATEDTVIY